MPPREEQRRFWGYRMVEHLRGNQTELGALVIAILGKAPSHPPRIVSRGVITLQGDLIAGTQAPWERHSVTLRKLGSVAEVRDRLRRVCDALALSDTEREDFFGEFRKWIKKDWRRQLAPIDEAMT